MNFLPTEPTQIDWARLAAYIDGEGCIRIERYPNGKPHHMDVQIANTDMRLHLWLQSTFGGKIIEKKHNKYSFSRLWIWQTSTYAAQEILEGCLPFFIMKREQAEHAIAYQKLVRMHKDRAVNGSGQGKAVPAEEMAARYACRTALIVARKAHRQPVFVEKK